MDGLDGVDEAQRATKVRDENTTNGPSIDEVVRGEIVRGKVIAEIVIEERVADTTIVAITAIEEVRRIGVDPMVAEHGTEPRVTDVRLSKYFPKVEFEVSKPQVISLK